MGWFTPAIRGALDEGEDRELRAARDDRFAIRAHGNVTRAINGCELGQAGAVCRDDRGLGRDELSGVDVERQRLAAGEEVGVAGAGFGRRLVGHLDDVPENDAAGVAVSRDVRNGDVLRGCATGCPGERVARGGPIREARVRAEGDGLAGGDVHRGGGAARCGVQVIGDKAPIGGKGWEPLGGRGGRETLEVAHGARAGVVDDGVDVAARAIAVVAARAGVEVGREGDEVALGFIRRGGRRRSR